MRTSVTSGLSRCEQNTHTSHFLVFHSTHFNVTRDIGSRCLSASCHPCFMRSGCFDSLRLSTSHSSPSLSHLPFHSPDLHLHLHLPCGLVRGEVHCALPRMRSKALWPRTILSQVMSPASSTTTRSQRPLKSSSRSLPATAGPQICMTWRLMTTPSVERSLHHCSPRSEKIQRAVDKLVTLLTKACCQVSRRLSVMLEQGDLFSMSLDHLLKRQRKSTSRLRK